MDKCTCKITPGTSAYGGNQIDSRGCEKHDTRDEIIEQLRQERDNALRYVELLIAERDAARAVEARLTEKADLLDWIEQKIGNVYEGIETVRLHRDDSTNSFIVAIGKDSLAGYGHSLVAALRAAKAGGK